MDKKNIAIVIAIGEIIVALPLYGIYTSFIRFYGIQGYWEPASIATNILGILFIALPLLGFYGAIKNKAFGYVSMGLFPIVAFVFGVTAIPFIKYLYGPNTVANAYIIGAINILTIALVTWLFFTRKKC